MGDTSNRYWPICISLALALTTFAVFWQVREHEFIDFDDDLYVTNNSNVQAGLTAQGIKWAFTTAHAYNWHPLVWISHMLDCRLYGINPAGHHFTVESVAWVSERKDVLSTFFWLLTMWLYVRYVRHPCFITYPHPGADLALWQILASALLLLCISVGVIRLSRSHRWLIVGWPWYLGTLLPVIGLMKRQKQSAKRINLLFLTAILGGL